MWNHGELAALGIEERDSQSIIMKMINYSKHWKPAEALIAAQTRRGEQKWKKKLRLKHEKLFRGAKGERKYQFS